MADNITIPATGSGDATPKVSTDQLGTGEHVQYVKLFDGTANSTNALIVTAAGAVSINVAQVAGSTVATAATGIQKVGLTDGTGNAITSTSGHLDVNIASGGGAGFSATDEAAWTAGATAFAPIGGVFNDTATALTTGQEGTARLTTNRGIHVNLRTAAGAEIGTSGAPVRIDPTGTTTQPVSDGGGSITVDNAGTFAVQDSQVIVDNAAFVDGTTKVFMGGYILDETAGTALTENDAAAARIDSKRAQVHVIEDATTRGRRATVSAAGAILTDASATTQPISVASLPLPTGAATSAKQPALGTAGSPSADVLTVQGSSSGTPIPVQGLPGTSGGYLISRVIAAASTNATSAKASAGQVYGYDLSNNAAYDVFLKLYNKASAPTVGTDTPVITIKIPAGSGRNVEYENGIAFGTGIAYAITKLIADSDTTVLVANDAIVNLFYK